jgi:5'-nucleotidase / UDP-sugar diphosphatase
MKRLCIFFITGLIILHFCLPITWAGEPVRIRLLYVNDFHGFAEPYQPSGRPDKLGGIAFLAGEANRLRQERPTLLLAAGDMIQGNPWANLFKGKSSIEVMNAMHFSAMVLGNHEFDYGQDVLQARIHEAHFPVLAANVQTLPGVKPYVITRLGGIKIAIIGLVTEDTPITTHPDNVQGLSFTSAFKSAQKILKELDKKVDLVLVLSHLGLPADQRLARAVKGIQVIVGGHTHTRVDTPMKVNGTIIVQAWEHAKALGVLDLTVKDHEVMDYEGKLIMIRPDRFSPDPLVAGIVEGYERQVDAKLNEIIGEAEVDLKGNGSRFQETNLGDLIADVLRKATKADAAIINGGGIRADISKGPIRMKDLFSVLPFRNHPVVIKITGRELEEIMEHGFSNLSGEGGQFPQISGVRLIYDSTASPGKRIKQIRIQDKPLEPETWYTLATNDFLIAGGDGYALFPRILANKRGYPTKSPRVVLYDSGKDIRELVQEYIKEKKHISALREGRIRDRE